MKKCQKKAKRTVESKDSSECKVEVGIMCKSTETY